MRDRFHLVQRMSNAVKETRKAERRALSKKGGERLEGPRQLWLYAEESPSARQLARFEELKDLSLFSFLLSQ